MFREKRKIASCPHICFNRSAHSISASIPTHVFLEQIQASLASLASWARHRIYKASVLIILFIFFAMYNTCLMVGREFLEHVSFVDSAHLD